MTSLKWYVLQSHPRREDLLFKHVTTLGFDCYYPTISVHPKNPRARKRLPYFPGYLFVHIDLLEIGDSMFKWMPYSVGLVSFGGEPAMIQESIIQAISAHVVNVNTQKIEDHLKIKPGDPIEISSGPLKGLEGILDMRLSGKQRVRVLLKLLSQDSTISVVIPLNQINPKKG